MSRERFPHPIVGLSPWPTLCRAWAVLGLLGLRLARQRPGAGPDPNHPLSCSLSHGSVAGQRRGYFFDRVAVHFDDGTSQDPMASGRISSGEGNCIINLLGQRSIESVGRWYYEEPRGTIWE